MEEHVAEAPTSGGTWNRAFTTQWVESTTTGGVLWAAGFRLAEFFETTDLLAALRPLPASDAAPRRPRVLELGSGCGWLGIAAALNNPGIDVVLTDQETEGQLELTQRNIDGCGVDVQGRCTALPLDWVLGNPAVEDVAYELVFGSDLVYNEAGVELLPDLLVRLLAAPGARFVYAHTRYRYEDSDMTFLRNLRERGLCVREVWPRGGTPPPPSPAPMTEVFPEKRIVMWEIQSEASLAASDSSSLPYERAARHPTDTLSFDDESD